MNRIAAGEVVERPASVVKELVENAIDAGATRIVVELEDGGRQLIRVVDNGCGMMGAELRLAVAPHATSKVATDDDLFSIRTMGFRGEALASISSVSRLRIASRLPDAVGGYEVLAAGERIDEPQPVGCPAGTTVEVRDLFFNVPARRKFLRGAPTEMGHVSEQVARIALAHPAIAFELRHNTRLSLNLPAVGTRLERIAKFYGPELSGALLCITRDERGLRLEAFAAPPVQSRATAQWQYVFVNGRYIRDRFIQHAIREAYRGLMEPNRHAVVFLFLSVEPSDVDVNVHPTKIEVRWADSNLVHSQVLSALRESLQRADLVPALRTDRAAAVPPEVAQRMRAELASVLRTEFEAADEASRTLPGFSPSGGSVPRYGTERDATDSASASRAPSMDAWMNLYRRPDASAPPVSEPWPGAVPRFPGVVPQGPMSAGSPFASAAGPPPRRAVQMHNLYLVAETEEGILIIDQHALHERVIYEQLRERITSGALESQRLLLPETLRVPPEHTALPEHHAELLHRLGVDATATGLDTIAVHAAPSLLRDADVTAFMRDLLDYLAQQAAGASQEVVIHRVLDMMACKAAVKAGDALTDAEVQSLMAQRHLIDKATSCPHGRPTILRLTKADLNRQFKR